MAQLLQRRATAVWVGLVLATVVAWQLSLEYAFDGATARAMTTAAILAVALVKARYVGLDFMELRHAPRVLRMIFNAWIFGVYGVLVRLYLFG
jgi:hypothetical protein